MCVFVCVHTRVCLYIQMYNLKLLELRNTADSSLTCDKLGPALLTTRGTEQQNVRADYYQQKKKSCLTVISTVEAEAYNRVRKNSWKIVEAFLEEYHILHCTHKV